MKRSIRGCRVAPVPLLHSFLRAGLASAPIVVTKPACTSLKREVDYFKIMGQTGHAKVDTLKEYDRRENDFDDHPGEDFL